MFNLAYPHIKFSSFFTTTTLRWTIFSLQYVFINAPFSKLIIRVFICPVLVKFNLLFVNAPLTSELAFKCLIVQCQYQEVTFVKLSIQICAVLQMRFLVVRTVFTRERKIASFAGSPGNGLISDK